jgi:hypothetical protein
MLRVHVRKDDIGTAHAVDIPLSPLQECAARLQLNLFGLSSNNVTYAAMGEGALGYWDFFPGPSGWGCPPCWGFADVIDSRVPSVAIGTRYYGYFPLGETLDVSPINVSVRGFADGAPHRANKAAVYNQYQLNTADPLYDPEFEPEQVLFRPVFSPGWWLADFVHQRSPHTVVMSSASSKTALATAYQLRRLGQYRLVGLTSVRNAAFTRDTALYHEVLSYEDITSLPATAPTTYLDFLGRESLTAKVHEVLGESLTRSVLFGATDWTDKPGGVQPPKVALKRPTPEFFFTSSHRDARLSEDPALSVAMQRDMRAYYQSSRKFVTIHNVRGVDEIISCWIRLLSGDVRPREGLVLQFR